MNGKAPIVDQRVDLRDPEAIQGQYSELLDKVREAPLEKSHFEQWIVVLREARASNLERQGMNAPSAKGEAAGKVLQMVPKTSKPPFGVKL